MSSVLFRRTFIQVMSSVRVNVQGVFFLGLFSLLLLPRLFLDHGMSIERCVPTGDKVAWAGVQLALLRSSDHCANGEMALGGDATHALRLVVMITLPLLIANLVAAAVISGATSFLSWTLGVVTQMLACLFTVPGLREPELVIPVGVLIPVEQNSTRRSVDLAVGAGRAPPCLAMA